MSSSVIDRSDRLYNEDLAPSEERNWTTYSLFAMWMADVHSVGGYVFAAGLFALGLVGWQVLLALVIGIALVNVAMNWMGYAGQRTGVPFPVLARLSFGVFGANLPALVRAIVAIFWYGIQTWLASVALVVLLLRVFPGLESLTENSILGLSTLGWSAFLFLWAVQLVVFRRGMETVRRFVDWAGPAIWVVMLALTAWIVWKARGDISLNISSKQLSGNDALVQFLAAISLTVTYFSALMLNFCDFSRFAPSKRAVTVGNFWGLPVNFLAFAVVSVVTTAGGIVVFGEAIFDPVELVGRIDNTAAVLLGAVTFAVATIGINIVANFVSPCYDLANIAPKYIDFKRAGTITAVAALVVLPWKVFANPVAVNLFLGGLGAFLGPLFAIMMVDYYLIRRGVVVIEDLYSVDPDGAYSYRKGWNPKALYAFVPSSAIAALVAFGSTDQLRGYAPFSWFQGWAPFSWFIGAGIAAVVYYAISRTTPVPGEPASTVPAPELAVTQSN